MGQTLWLCKAFGSFTPKWSNVRVPQMSFDTWTLKWYSTWDKYIEEDLVCLTRISNQSNSTPTPNVELSCRITVYLWRCVHLQTSPVKLGHAFIQQRTLLHNPALVHSHSIHHTLHTSARKKHRSFSFLQGTKKYFMLMSVFISNQCCQIPIKRPSDSSLL